MDSSQNSLPDILKILLHRCTIVILVFLGAGGAQQWSLVSPNGRVEVIVELGLKAGQADYPSSDRLYYSVRYGPDGDRAEALLASPLGLVRADRDFTDGLSFVSVTADRAIEESYTMVHGKRRECFNSANEKVISFDGAQGGRMDLVVRAYNDGAAFRYGFPEQETGARVMEREMTGFRVPASSRCWMLPYDCPSGFTPACENNWTNATPAGVTSPTNCGWCLPALFNAGESDLWVLLAESDLDKSYCGVHLEPAAPQSVYRVRFPESGEANGVGIPRPSSTLPWYTPWRVIITGTLADIVQSTLVTDLATPSEMESADWIRPGPSSWSWWSLSDSPRDYNALVPFVDLAAEMGWPYSLVDANWNMMQNGSWTGLEGYARGKNVGILLWYNTGGPNNSVGEQPRDRMFDAAAREQEMSSIAASGASGVKVDFFHGENQTMTQLYLDILETAARHELIVNYHGCTMPRGWDRTYPHLMTMEAVRGAEAYKFSDDYRTIAPWHNTVLAFTRNVVGPMDYTPVVFSANRRTTMCHELACAVAFESGITHMADNVTSYRSLPEAVNTFLKALPPAWDDTRFVDGRPGERAVLARRGGDDWFIGGISGMADGSDRRFSLSFLPSQTFYSATLITDNGSGGFAVSSFDTLSADSVLPVRIAANGGCVAHLSYLFSVHAARHETYRQRSGTEALSYSVANGDLIISLSDGPGESRGGIALHLYTAGGRCVYRGSFPARVSPQVKPEMTIRGLPAGVYMAHAAKGGTTFRERCVIVE